MVDVIYSPIDPADPAVTECHGFRFVANKPTSVPEGTAPAAALLALVETNPWFSIAGKKKKKADAKDDALGTPEEYRAYAIGWINAATSSDELQSRWDSEYDMRKAVGWSGDDDDALAPIYQPKKDNLVKAERQMS